MDIEVVHKATGRTRFHKWLALLAGLAAVLATLFATLDMHSNKREEQALSKSARLSVEIFGRIAASNPVQTAGYQAAATASSRAIESLARRIVGTDFPGTGDFETALGEADERAAERLQGLSETVGGVPPESSGVDAHTREVIASDVDELTRMVQEQNRQRDVADKFFERGTRSVYALSILALAAVLLGLAAVLGERGGGSITMVVAGLALLFAIGWGGSALTV
jgi:hypothetical protein